MLFLSYPVCDILFENSLFTKIIYFQCTNKKSIINIHHFFTGPIHNCFPSTCPKSLSISLRISGPFTPYSHSLMINKYMYEHFDSMFALTRTAVNFSSILSRINKGADCSYVSNNSCENKKAL